MNKFNISIAKRINSLREAKGLSWEKLAYAAGVSKGGLSEIKNALVEAKLSTLYKIIFALGIKPTEFFDFEVDLSEFDI